MSAGREVRVIVEPSEVDDYALPQLAVAIARHIEADLAYPGEIKVTVVREMPRERDRRLTPVSRSRSLTTRLGASARGLRAVRLPTRRRAGPQLGQRRS